MPFDALQQMQICGKRVAVIENHHCGWTRSNGGKGATRETRTYYASTLALLQQFRGGVTGRTRNPHDV
jgi:hypothetical protein